MKLKKLYQSDVFVGGGTDEERLMLDAVEKVTGGGTDLSDLFDAWVARKVGIEFDHIGPVPFNHASRLLYHVYREFYPEFHPKEGEPGNYGGGFGEHWMMEDFRAFYDERGTPVLYHHFVHGDCGSTWFVVEED